MTAPKIFAPEYYQRMRELEEASWWNAGQRDVARRLLLSAGLPAQGLMLDVGCGSGQTMAWFRDHWSGWETVGLDVAREGLRSAPSGQVLAGSALAIPLPDASVDAIVTLDVLQHLPLPGGDARALAEMHRVLRPGGILFVRTNAQAIPHAPDDLEYNYHKYTSGELRSKLTTAGFATHRLGRVNALLGLAEIPRDLRARRGTPGSYVGLLSQVPRRGPGWWAKRAWLGLEGSLVRAGLSAPLGRTLVAVAHAREGGGPG